MVKSLAVAVSDKRIALVFETLRAFTFDGRGQPVRFLLNGVQFLKGKGLWGGEISSRVSLATTPAMNLISLIFPVSSFARTVIIGIFPAFTFGLGAQEAATAFVSKPNVLLILVDDLKPALGCYGDASRRPRTSTPSPPRDAFRPRLLQPGGVCAVALHADARLALHIHRALRARQHLRRPSRCGDDAPALRQARSTAPSRWEKSSTSATATTATPRRSPSRTSRTRSSSTSTQPASPAANSPARKRCFTNQQAPPGRIGLAPAWRRLRITRCRRRRLRRRPRRR